MKIHSIEINNIRGIRTFQHDFGGKNAVVFGANGTGKSSVIDAIDFLLTGNIARLLGEGTAGITLQKHGPHVLSSEQPHYGYVKASIRLPGISQPVLIERQIRNPKVLMCPDVDSRELNRLLRLAMQGQHLLTRRQMLRFITVSPRDRAEQIQSLLSLKPIEDVRSNLVRVNGKLKQSRDLAQTELEAAQSSVASILGLEKFSENLALHTINNCRETLGASTLESVSTESIIAHISIPQSGEKSSVSPVHLIEHATRLLQCTSDAYLRGVIELEGSLREKLNVLRRDPTLLRSLSQQKLLELGITLADGDSCPLCDMPWKNHDLVAHLEQKIARASSASRILSEIVELEQNLRGKVNDIVSNLEPILTAPDLFEVTTSDGLQDWKAGLVSFRTELQDSLKYYEHNDVSPTRVIELFAPKTIRTDLQYLKQHLVDLEVESGHRDSPETAAYNRLIRAETALNRLEKCETNYGHRRRAFDLSVSLNKHYIAARDRVLNGLYRSISFEFESLYSKLHPDEKSFKARFRPQDSGLNLDVKFYDSGMFPPNALHSEGHQDSMGLCLFLVLSNRLSEDALQVVLLDDVVTSVDRGHRKDLAKMLAKEFADRQVIVTTHERIWLEQLKTERFVSKSNIVRFPNWNIFTGPVFDVSQDIWDEIESDLVKDKVNAAASSLRHWAEAFFRQVCDRFQVPVIYRIDEKWELAHFFDPARGAVKDSLKQAKDFAQRSGNCKSFHDIQLLDNHRRNIYSRIDSVRSLINLVVHYNTFENVTPSEFGDVVSAFKDLHNMLHCDKCKHMMSVSRDPKFIYCECGKINWKLE